MICLGIGDPDTPDARARSSRRMQEAVAEPEHPPVPVQPRPRRSSARRSRDFYERRFGVDARPRDARSSRRSAPRSASSTSTSRSSIPGDVALASDPGYPVYTGGPLLVGRRARADAARARARLRARPRRDRAERRRERAKLMFLNYPNNPTGAVVPDGFFERVVEFAREHDILVVHDNAYSEIDLRRLRRAVVPRHAGRQGGRRRGLLAVQGLQHDRLALRGDRRQRRGDRRLLAAEDEHRLGHVRGGAARRRRGAVARRRRRGRRDERALPAPPRPRVSTRCARSASRSRRRKGTIYVWAPVPEGYESAAAYCEHVLEEAGVVVSPGGAYGPERRGLLPHLADDARRPPHEAVERLGRLAA